MFGYTPKRGDVIVVVKEVKEQGFLTSKTVALPGMVGVVTKEVGLFDLTGTVTVRLDGGHELRLRPDQIEKQRKLATR